MSSEEVGSAAIQAAAEAINAVADRIEAREAVASDWQQRATQAEARLAQSVELLRRYTADQDPAFPIPSDLRAFLASLEAKP